MITKTIQTHPFQCQYCHRTFAREKTFENHRCEKMKRYERFQTPTGQTAWTYYQKWRKYQRRSVNTKETFIASRYFNSFFLFVEHAKKLNFPDIDTFIRLMIQRDYPPVMWCSDEVYGEYISFLDRTTDPHRQLIITLRTLDQISTDRNIDVSDIFVELTANEVITLIMQRKMSAWVLLRSKKFSEFFKRLTTEQQQIIKTVLRFDYWSEKFEKHKKELETIDRIVSQLQI